MTFSTNGIIGRKTSVAQDYFPKILERSGLNTENTDGLAALDTGSREFELLHLPSGSSYPKHTNNTSG
jgi:hypothetical protein